MKRHSPLGISGLALVQEAGHGATIGVQRFNGRIQNIFESGKVGYGFLSRRAQHLVRRALSQNTSAVEHQRVFAESKHFFAAVRDIENGDAVGFVPGAQIVDDSGFGGGVKRGQRLV